jgi:tetratricopeptide (TPR) repeat protein
MCVKSMTTVPSKATYATQSGWRRRLNHSLAISGLLTALWAVPALADEAGDVSRLLRAGELAEAMTKADAFLARQPRDPQMRFLKGVILTEQNRQAEAIAIFTRLTEDFPDLPEPYNNLAVLHAAAGQYDKARNALDMAIRTNPSYATAYENLGDVHARLASQAYDKALQLDSGNTVAKSKLTLLRSLSAGGGTQPVAAAKTPAAPTVVAQAPKPAPVPAPEPKPAPAPAPAAAQAPKPTPAVDTEQVARDQVLAAVLRWAKAWSDQDMKDYLDSYASDFKTPNGQSRKEWTAQREARIVGKDRIQVTVEQPRVTINGNTATVRFHQTYVSNRLNANTRKMLVLVKQNGKWRIQQERIGN